MFCKSNQRPLLWQFKKKKKSWTDLNNVVYNNALIFLKNYRPFFRHIQTRGN